MVVWVCILEWPVTQSGALHFQSRSLNSFLAPNLLHISTSSSSSMSSTTILTSTRASRRPEISRMGWQCSPFSMRYVKNHTCLCSLSSKFCFFVPRNRSFERPHQDVGTISDIWARLLLEEVHSEVLGGTIWSPLKWLTLCFFGGRPAAFKSIADRSFMRCTAEPTLVSRGTVRISAGRGRHCSNTAAGIQSARRQHTAGLVPFSDTFLYLTLNDYIILNLLYYTFNLVYYNLNFLNLNLFLSLKRWNFSPNRISSLKIWKKSLCFVLFFLVSPKTYSLWHIFQMLAVVSVRKQQCSWV